MGLTSKLGQVKLGQFKLAAISVSVVIDDLTVTATNIITLADSDYETITTYQELLSSITEVVDIDTLYVTQTLDPTLDDFIARVDALTAIITNIPSLADEAIVNGFVADVLINTATQIHALIGDADDSFIMQNLQSLLEDAELSDVSHQLIATIIEIVETGNTDDLNYYQTLLTTVSDIVDTGTTDTLTSSQTLVVRLSERFINDNLTPVGPGTGGEIFPINLAPSGVTFNTVLSSDISAFSSTMILANTSDLPSGGGFVVRINNEVIYVRTLTGNTASNLVRGMSNTTPTFHLAGSQVDWTDEYDMAIVSQTDAVRNITYLSQIQRGFITIIDCSQAYIGSSRYRTYIKSCIGVFPTGTGTSGTAKTDAEQINSVNTGEGLSDLVPVGLSFPLRISADIVVGDTFVCRYKNSEDVILTLGPRSALAQVWYGFVRVNNANSDVTDTEPYAHIIDGDTFQTYSNSSATVAATLNASERYFTNPTRGFSDTGVLMSGLAVRHGQRRVPFWTSPNWHNFDWVFNGFGTDCNFIQTVARRRNVDLPSNSNLTGPNADWDDPTYYTSTAWHVVLTSYAFEAIFVGPSFNGTPVIPNSTVVIPIGGGGGSAGGGGGGVGPGGNPDEGGSGGNIGIPTVGSISLSLDAIRFRGTNEDKPTSTQAPTGHSLEFISFRAFESEGGENASETGGISLNKIKFRAYEQ